MANTCCPSCRQLTHLEMTTETNMDTKTRLKELIATTFNCEAGTLSDDTGPGDIPGWDSIGHVTLMLEIQRVFGREVPVEQAVAIESIAELSAVLEGLG